MILAPIALAFLVIFTYKNPDNTDDCWVSPSYDFAYTEPQDLPLEINVAQNWHTWFKVGVYLTTCYILHVLVHLVFMLYTNDPHRHNWFMCISKYLLQGIFALLALIWTIFGSKMRFDRSGSIASEEWANGILSSKHQGSHDLWLLPICHGL